MALRKGLFATVGLIAGVGTVAGGTKYAMSQVKEAPFSFERARYDLSTFQGRYYEMLAKCDPSLCLLENTESIQKADQLLQDLQEKQRKGEETIPSSSHSDIELWSSRTLKETALHPDTGEQVPPPFRMSGYVPYNGPICVAMMVSKSTPVLLFWNWVNQSHNALVNYFHRNASSTSTTQTMVMSYCGAVGAAVSVAFGLSTIVKRSFSPEKARILLQFIAFPSSMVASSANCYIMRSPEIPKGVSLLDKDKNPLVASGGEGGLRSSIAAKQAVFETVLSRVALQFPVFLAPALVMSLPPVTRITTSSPALGVGLYTFLSIVCFGFGLPAAIAIFPQNGKIRVDKIEPELQQSLQDHEYVYYNKGL